MRTFLFLLFLFTHFTLPVLAQTPIDTVEAELEQLVVTGYQTNRTLLETPGSVHFVNAQTLSAFDNGSILYGLNTVPGVKMEERAPGSYRIAIRGSALRSPFGIRNVKIYWNGIPLTEPTGSTFLNLLDPYNLQQIEVLKGPGGSVYGAGNGGVLLIRSTQPFVADHLRASTTVGSFGTFNYDLSYHDFLENGQISFKYSNSQTDGYREQSFLSRRVLEVSGITEYAEGRSIEANVLFSELNYGIPGGLTLEQFRTNPTQSRPGNRFVAGSVESNASIKQEQMLFGITHSYQITERFSNEASAFGSFSDFENPFNLDYKVDSRKSGGFRSVYAYDFDIASAPASITAGSEYQASSYAARNYGNNNGQTDTLNFDDELKVKSLLIFGSLQIDLPTQIIFTAGLSFNSLLYDINRLFAAAGYGTTDRIRKQFDNQLIPRIGLAKVVNEELTVHSSFGYGFSPPTIEEVRTNEGSINLGLEAEKGTNFELGARGSIAEGRLRYDVTAFLFKLDNSIVQQESERGTVLFRNAGNTRQQGLELSMNYLLFENFHGFFKKATIRSSYTFNDFEFENYETTTGDFSGNALTGVAPHNVVSAFQLELKPGFYTHLSHNFTDKIPLNDGNTVYSEAYHLVQSRIGFTSTIFTSLKFDIHLGIDNLLDEEYSLGYDINAFGARYFQPAPERNWFMSISLNYAL
jgi:iron complex outermembrane receptor protein